jgi:hypothetical protein
MLTNPLCSKKAGGDPNRRIISTSRFTKLSNQSKLISHCYDFGSLVSYWCSFQFPKAMEMLWVYRKTAHLSNSAQRQQEKFTNVGMMKHCISHLQLHQKQFPLPLESGKWKVE